MKTIYREQRKSYDFGEAIFTRKTTKRKYYNQSYGSRSGWEEIEREKADKTRTVRQAKRH